jgi:hypothetical protein
MKIKLQAWCLWRAIDPGDDVSEPEDRLALDALCSAVPPAMVSTLVVKPTTKLAWEAVRIMQIGDDRLRKTTAQRVRRQYEELVLKEGEGVEDFSLRLTNIVSQLATLGDPEDPTKIVEKYLRNARERYKQLVVSMETLLDISTLSIEEVTGRLLASEDDPESKQNLDSGKLYLTEEQWLERYKAKEQENSRTGGGSRGRGRRRPARGKVRDGSSIETRDRSTPSARNSDRCRYCGIVGHWARECRNKKRDEQAQAHVAQEGEDTLLLLESCTEVPSPTCVEGSRVMRQSPAGDGVHLSEHKAFAVLDNAKEERTRRWIFDTGASNHMTGTRAFFSDLDTSIVGTMRFGDGAVARIEGRGTILFECKTGEHRPLPNTYFIPRLTTNIISCGQLDETGYEILIREG